MVCLDARRCRCGIMAGALDDIGIERSLGQEADRATLFRQPQSFFLEDTDKLFADDLTLLLRVDDTGKTSQETLARVDYDERDMQVTTEGIDDLFSLASSQAACIDEDTGELVANGLVNKQGRNTGIHTPRESAYNPLLAYTLAYLLNRFFDRRTGSPTGFAAADTEEEVADDLFSLRCMGHFGMKL